MKLLASASLNAPKNAFYMQKLGVLDILKFKKGAFQDANP